MALSDALRGPLESARSIAGTLGLRPYTVTVSVRSWSGDEPGEGVETVAVAPITERGQPPRVKFLNDEQIALGQLARGAVEIGPITPAHAGGGTPIDTLVGTSAHAGEVMHFTLSGPEIPDGARYSLTRVSSDSALHYTLTLEPVAQ